MRGSSVPDGGVRRSVGSAFGPFAGPSLECPGTAAVDEGSNKRVDGPLDGGSDENLLEVVRAFEGFRRVGAVIGCGATSDRSVDQMVRSRAKISTTYPQVVNEIVDRATAAPA